MPDHDCDRGDRPRNTDLIELDHGEGYSERDCQCSFFSHEQAAEEYRNRPRSIIEHVYCARHGVVSPCVQNGSLRDGPRNSMMLSMSAITN
jgi:hypothetical protein